MNEGIFCVLTAIFSFFIIQGFSLESFVDKPRVFLLNDNDLIELQKRVSFKDPVFDGALESLLTEADRDLEAGPYSVMDKTNIPPSSDKHDYMSLARYWWPDPSKKDGRPYIRRDGEVNPQTAGDDFDYDRMIKMQNCCINLSFAFFLTGDEKYSEHAIKLFRAWFLNPETRMNPHLNYAEAVPGKNTGRSFGIIETYQWPLLFDAISLLTTSKYWTNHDQIGIDNWIKDLLTWLLTSPNGLEESKASNNHGSWYDAQVAHYALYTQQPELAKMHLEKHTVPRLKKHFTDSGEQPFELKRTKSYNYCIYNLKALFQCAVLGEKAGVDLWNVKSNKNAILYQGLEWLLPFITGGKKWINMDIVPFDATLVAPLLILAATAYKDPRYMELYEKIMADRIPSERLRLFYPKMFFTVDK